MEVFILFQTDQFKSKHSRVCFGVFETEIAAIDAAKENNLYSYNSEIVIESATLGEFQEI